MNINSTSSSPPPASTAPDNTPSQPRRLGFEGWVLNRQQYQLYDQAGHSAKLTSGEYKLLEALVLSANKVLSREYLFNLTRHGTFDTRDRVIDVQVARIRKKLNGDKQTLIRTVRSRGYMFCGNVQPID